MNRQEFTLANSILETEMREAGEIWVNDWWLRSAQAQNALYMQGRKKNEDGTIEIVDESKVVTQCDGYKTPSNHQGGRAVDKYFVINGDIIYNWPAHPDLIEKYKKWHERAEELGMKKMLIFKNGTIDAPHFEG